MLASSAAPTIWWRGLAAMQQSGRCHPPMSMYDCMCTCSSCCRATGLHRGQIVSRSTNILHSNRTDAVLRVERRRREAMLKRASISTWTWSMATATAYPAHDTRGHREGPRMMQSWKSRWTGLRTKKARVRMAVKEVNGLLPSPSASLWNTQVESNRPRVRSYITR